MVSKKTFPGGVHPGYFKELSRRNPIRRLEPPPEVIIPLIQHIGEPCLPTVKAGDAVRSGTLIGKSEEFISALIHSSVSGKVKSIKPTAHPITGRCDSVTIESDGRDEMEELTRADGKGVEGLTADEIEDIIRAAGIVGLGGGAFPTHAKLTLLEQKPIDTFILNGAECEPYLTCDERVMIERPKEVLEGALLIMKALGAGKGIIAIEDNKPEAIKAIRTALNTLHPTPYTLHPTILHTKYPQGSEKQLIKAILNREIPPGVLPFEVGCMVDNVQTALAVYEAVYKKKSLYERVITVTGDAIKEPSNLLVRIGTPVSYLIEKCGGLKDEAFKIIMGGPMMGIAQYTSDIPVIKGTSGILILGKDSAQVKPSEYCIRCGKCIEACPVNLVPTTIAKAAECSRFDIAEEFNARDCMECGGCAYLCPSKIPLVQLIRYAKGAIV